MLGPEPGWPPFRACRARCPPATVCDRAAAADGSVRSKGTMYFVLHPHGQRMSGRWVGMSYDGKIVSGWGAMARDADDAKMIIQELKGQGRGFERADL